MNIVHQCSDILTVKLCWRTFCLITRGISNFFEYLLKINEIYLFKYFEKVDFTSIQGTTVTE